MKAKTILELTKDGLKSIFSNKLVSALSILTVVISLSIINIFTILNVTINKNIANLQNEVKVIAFLEDGIDEERIKELNQTIETMDEIAEVEFVSEEQGLEKYKENINSSEDSEMAGIVEEVTKDGNNPIPASFEIKAVDPESIETIKDELLKQESIYKVDDASLVTDFLTSVKGLIGKVGSFLIVVMIVVSIILISNSIKVAVHMRKNEISIMKYIGATHNYVRLPFVIEGLFIGLIGAIVSIIMLSIVYGLAGANITETLNSYINGFVFPSLSSLLLVVVPTTLVIGIATGGIGSFVSIRKYLNV